MRLLRVLFLRLRSLSRGGRVEQELEREIGLHLEALTAELRATGLSEDEARREARRQFGAADLAMEQCRDERRVTLAADFARDVRYALRGFLRSPGFAVTAIASLALGLGANAVVFSAINGLLLRPLPGVQEPERIQFVNNRGNPSNSFPAYRDMRDRNTVFASLFGYRIAHISLSNSTAGAVRIWGLLATGNYFEALGVQPALGRFFSPSDDLRPNGHPVAVLSYDFWQVRFASDPGIVDREIRLNGMPYRVLGVAPRGFRGTESFYWPDIWVPMMMQPAVEGRSTLEGRGTQNTWIAGRLKPGITPQQAEENLGAIGAQLAREHRSHEGMRLSLSPPGFAGTMGRTAVSAFTGGILLLAALVLLAACFNLAGLQTARGLDRARELAIRLSIGAGRGRIVRQLVTESLVLAVCGGVAGLAGAAVVARIFSQWQPVAEFPVRLDIAADWRVFSAGIAAALFTGGLVGLAVARRVWSMSLSARPVRRFSLQDCLLPVQMALCCLLVAVSFAAVRGLAASIDGASGIRPDGVAYLAYDLHAGGYDPARGAVFHRRIQEAVSQLPGVEAAAYGSSVPLNPDHSSTSVYPLDTVEFVGRNAVSASYYKVSPGYFATLGTRFESGRDFSWHDGSNAPRVAIVNRTLARRIGSRFLAGPGRPVEVIGVVEDGKYQTLTEDPRAVVFFPILQSHSQEAALIARSGSRPEAELAAEMRRVIASHDANVAVFGAGSYRRMMGLVYLPMRAAAGALGAFGLLALMLAVTGIYGAAAHNVSRRTKEIGIRMALGARPGQTLRFVFTRLAMLVLAGALAGFALAAASAGPLAIVVYSASPRDAAVIAPTVACIAAVSLLAAWGPARRSVRIDPLRAIRQD